MTSKEWSKLHPIRWKRQQQKYRLAHQKPCRLCGRKIIRVKSGQRYCKSCYIKEVPVKRKQYYTQYQQKVYAKYCKFKENLGCKICHYNKYGGALDFHHLDMKSKERRISALLWKAQSDKYKKEVKKCVLLCKNCHYEVHYKERQKQHENGDIE